MNIFIDDDQVVADLESTLVEFLQQGPVEMLVSLLNTGANVISYRFQLWNGTTWVDMDLLGTDLNNTLSIAQRKTMKVTSAYPRVRIVGNASGGSILDFSVTRFFTRSSGGNAPILAL